MDATGDMVSGQGCRGRHRACDAYWRLPGRSDVLLLLALLCAPPAFGAAAVDIAAVVGFADTFQPGRWTPLSVTVTNRGGDLIGELEVQITGGDALRGRPYITSY